MSLNWMAWTLPTAIFFITILCLLIAMTIWQSKWPSIERKGFMPIKTTPGDRLFVGLLGSAFIHLLWIGLTSLSLWFAFILALIWIIVVMIWG
ncbi:MAG: DUF2160 domain-containing protein [Deltaproteobacteria bacterium]|nr:DUF2160 domain-containing protein [Deltaproteobacteria bacterium]NCP03753.1 DUF2160 domain-containing protein [Deltaproteobacteria bacterium]